MSFWITFYFSLCFLLYGFCFYKHYKKECESFQMVDHFIFFISTTSWITPFIIERTSMSIDKEINIYLSFLNLINSERLTTLSESQLNEIKQVCINVESVFVLVDSPIAHLEIQQDECRRDSDVTLLFYKSGGSRGSTPFWPYLIFSI